MPSLAICAGCSLRKEPGILHIDLPPVRECMHLEACARAYNIGHKEGKPNGASTDIPRR